MLGCPHGGGSERVSPQTVVRSQPLPDSQYNGNPESVGYRIKWWCPDLPSVVQTQVISDRLEREFTVEGLEEWTEYALQMQAFNAIGAGPWSEAVRGRTRESGESGPRALPCLLQEELSGPRLVASHWLTLTPPHAPYRIFPEELGQPASEPMTLLCI